MILRLTFIVLLISAHFNLLAQNKIHGTISDVDGLVLPFANVLIDGTNTGTSTNANGYYELETSLTGTQTLLFSYVGYLSFKKSIEFKSVDVISLNVSLTASPELNEVVVTGNLREMSRKESTVPVEVYSPVFFKHNPNPSIYESMHSINGIRPQLNCNICNTGDIHINGLEGAYTMVLIDGMPIVSGLSSVYGLMGIPNSMVERIEVVKGPASAIYGSEAMGGVINVITKIAEDHPLFSADVMTTSWMEHNIDLALKNRIGKKTDVLTGIHLFNYQNAQDINNDNFTDVALSNQFSIFQKWNFKRDKNRLLSIGGRLYLEDRMGGEMNFNQDYRGSDSIYGESIYTRRFELMSKYRLPFDERLFLALSYTGHNQNSFYGTVPFMAIQNILFSQLNLEKQLGNHDLDGGIALRYTLYDDNTVATEKIEQDNIINNPDEIVLPGIFFQDEMALSEATKLLLGMRFDYHSVHGSIWTPRLGYKLNINEFNTIRLNAGTGFRVVNIFTEDHAALTGARDVVIQGNIDPEKSVNINLNYLKKIFSSGGNYWAIDASVWYSRFSNQIIADYDSDPNKIIYQNLVGYAISKGFSMNLDALVFKNWRLISGITLMDLYTVESDEFENETKTRPVLTENYSGKWSLSYTFSRIPITLDYTGSVYGPMRLPLLGPLDPREEYSDVWFLHNFQFTWKTKNQKWEFYTGIKNAFNFLPPTNSIARSNDPFDKEVEYDNNGNVLQTSQNPYALTFDPSYVFAPNQGRRYFIGLRFYVL